MSRSGTRIVIVDRVSRSDTRIVIMDRVSRSDTRIVIMDRVSRSDTRIVIMDRVSRYDTRIVIMDRIWTISCTDPYLYVFSLLFVGCSKRTVVFNSIATLASLHHVRFQGELLFLAWTGSLSSRLDALKFWHGLAV